MKIERTKNTVRNIGWAFFNKIVYIILPFVTRSMLIYTFGSEYIGLNSLFSSILQVLSLSELGLSYAVCYSLYKPIAEDDDELVCAILNLFKKLYRIIGIVIFAVGVLITPFIPKLVKGDCPAELNIYLLYLLYLFNTSISYWLFSYKSILFTASHRNDLSSRISIIVLFLQTILQITCLIFLKNYYLFICSLICGTVLNNILVAIITKKHYPQYVCKGLVPTDVKKDIKKQVSALTIGKVYGVLRNSLDSVVLSAFLGLAVLGKYQNYYYVINALCGITTIIITSMTAGFGNRIACESAESNYKLVNKLNYMYMWIAGVFSVCLLVLFQDFIRMWIGEEYFFGLDVVFAMTLYFYTMKLSEMIFIVKMGGGLWWEDRYRPLIEGIANLLLNIFLVKTIGVMGVLYSTIITMFFSDFIAATIIVFKNYFKRSSKEYFARHALYFVRTLFVCVISFYFFNNIYKFSTQNLIINFIIKGILAFAIANLFFVVLSFKDSLFKESKEYCISIFKSIFKK